MPSTNLSAKTKADLVQLAEISGLLSGTEANKMTRPQLLSFLKKAETAAAGSVKKTAATEKPAAKSKKSAATKATAETAKTTTTDATAEMPPASSKKTASPGKKTKTPAKNSAKADKEAAAAVKDDAAVLPEKTKVKVSPAKEKPAVKRTGRGRKPKAQIERVDSGEEKKNEAKPAAAADSEDAVLEVAPQMVQDPGGISAASEDAASTLTVDVPSVPVEQLLPEAASDDQSNNMVQTEREKNRSAQQAGRSRNGHVRTVESKTGERSARPADARVSGRPMVEAGEMVSGALEIMPDGYGFLRKDNYLQGSKDIYVPPQYIRRFNLRTGDLIAGPGKLQRETDRYQALLYIKEVNGMPPEKMVRRPQFDRLTPIYPDERYRLETARNELSTRIIDLAAPIGKGQRGMIVSPPKAGKTILLQKIANAISINNPEVKLIVLLIDERPEEVTDMQRSIKGEVVYSTFDKTPENHVKVTELVLERAMRLVELKQDVVILLDSMTRLARAYNLTINPTGRTLSGGLDPGALYGPKRFFGAARNIENGGSLTIIATSLIETGSRMDEVIFEEFKGTGNMEVYLDRKLSEKRIFPAIDINRSGTRREELLMSSTELDAVWTIRKAFSQLDTASVTETIINLLLKTQNNEHFISSINVSFNDKNVFDAMRGSRTGAAGTGSGGNGGSNGYGNGASGAGSSGGYSGR